MAKKKPESKRHTKKPKVALLPKGYEVFVGEVKERVRIAQSQAATAVNRVLIELYWHIGASIAERQRTQSWGKSIVERLARDLQTEFPGMSGFSPRNLWRMRAFYLAYSEEFRKLPQPVAEMIGLSQTDESALHLRGVSASRLLSPQRGLSDCGLFTQQEPDVPSINVRQLLELGNFGRPLAILEL